MTARTILHVDMDSFFASVEQQANPALRGVPVAVSGDPKSRTVVAAASKEAKKFGVRSAMTIGEARRLCPHIQFVLGDPDKYVEVSRHVIAILESFTPGVEVTSIDEAFLDVTGWCDAAGAVRIAQEIKQRIREEVGEWITCSVGVAPNKRIAKLASDFDKPDGIVLVYDDVRGPPNEISRLAPSSLEMTRLKIISRSDLLSSVSLRDLCGIGPRIEVRLHAMGITTVGGLAAAPLDLLVEEFGSYGYELHDMAMGNDESLVDAEDAEPKSMGHATTLSKDLRTLHEVRPVVEELSEKVAARLRRHGYRGSTVHVTLRFRDFTSHSEQTTISDATDDGLRISREVMHVLGEWTIRIPVRLVGVSIGKLARAAPVQAPLFPRDQRWQAATAALDIANDRYGEWTVQRASLLVSERVVRKVAAAFRATAHLKGK
ncbi:MAG: DNA polymerase IV [bacterium]|nr:DNA polymerase IV [bacterium]